MLIPHFILYSAFSNSRNFIQSMCLDHVHLPTATPPRSTPISLYPQIHIIHVWYCLNSLCLFLFLNSVTQ